MRKAILTLLVFKALTICSQRESKQIHKDFNDDGLFEEISIYFYLGEIDYAILSISEGAHRCTLDFSPNQIKPSLVNPVPICSELLKPDNSSILDSLEKYLFQIDYSVKPKPAAEWLKNAYFSKQILENHAYFSNCLINNSREIKGPYTNPGNYYFKSSSTEMNNLHHKNDSSSISWILFNGKSLSSASQLSSLNLSPDWPQIQDSIGNLKIYKTPHSVFLESDSSHQVLFVTDGPLFNNLQKLRWESIKQVKKYRDYIFVLTHPYPAIENKLYMIDLKNNILFEFKSNQFDNDELRYIDNIEIMEDELYFFMKETPSSLDISENSIPLILLRKSTDGIIEVIK